MSLEYDLFLNRTTSSELLTLSKKERRKIVGLLDRLASNPFFDVDHTFTDQKGRLVYKSIMEDFLVTFSIDHAIKEVKIHELLILSLD